MALLKQALKETRQNEILIIRDLKMQFKKLLPRGMRSMSLKQPVLFKQPLMDVMISIYQLCATNRDWFAREVKRV